MGLSTKIFIVVCAVIFVIIVFRLLTKRKINEKNSLYYIGGIFVIIILAFVPGILDNAAKLLGIDYPPALLFLISTLVLLYLVLKQSAQISELDDKVRELAQRMSLSQTEEKNKHN